MHYFIKKHDFKYSLFIVTFCYLFFMTGEGHEAFGGIRVTLKEGHNTEKVELYAGSYALLIGASDYVAGWPSLESIKGELDGVEQILSKKGFTIERVSNPDSQQLYDAFIQFINKYGYDSRNRLLFFFSGHGYTRKKGKKGYIVPVDAPDPDKDEKGFLTKALGMNHILSWARDIEAKHVLFLFDSCFSGTIFKQRDRVKPPLHITTMTTLPVRQFITAGQAGESVPANSTFTPMFIDALKYGLADLNRDGYVSGTELGVFLQEQVPLHAKQSPQFGKIQDYELSRGDFIFVAGIQKEVKEKTVSQGSKRESNVYIEPNTGMEFVWVSGNCFDMGLNQVDRNELLRYRGTEKYRQFYDNEREKIVKSWPDKKYLMFFNDERPEHNVCIDGFWMGRYEVTQDQWKKIMGRNPSRIQQGGLFPVEHVSWNDMQSFITILREKSGRFFRLPTEAEWEYAARGKELDYFFSGHHNADVIGWHAGNSNGATHMVGQKAPNQFGLYDMSGNVWEWTNDWYYGGYYRVSPKNNPQGPPSGSDKVIRGGSWDDGPFFLRVSCRNYTDPNSRYGYLGFRLMITDN